MEHSHKNLPIIKEICESVIIPVQYAGGIREMRDVELVMSTGISRLVMGTIVIEKPDIFKKIFEKYGPTKISISMDIIDEELVIKGRKIKTGINYKDFAKKMADIGVERFIVSDVLRNGVLSGPNLTYSKEVASITEAKVTLSGGIRNKDELMDVQNLMPLGIDSVIVGRALYENKFPCQKLWRVAESGIFK